MTIGRLIMIVIGIFIILVPAQFQEKISVWLAVLCVFIGCLIGSYPNIVKLVRQRKEGQLTKTSPIVKSLIGDAIWAVILIIGVVVDWYRLSL